MRSTITRLALALAAAAVIAVVEVWGWGDAVRTLAAGAGWLWRTGWPIVRVVALPLAAGGVLYLATSDASRRWWRGEPWRSAGRSARRAWLPLAVAGTVAVLTVVVLLAPGWVLARDTTVKMLTAEQRAKATSDARTALLQAVAGLLLAAGALATWRQVRITREGQVTERFTRAVDQLGSEHLDVRLGALYALERIARDSPGDRRTIAEILTAYIRLRAPWPPSQPGQYQPNWPIEQQPDLRTRAPDVQASLTVLGRGPFSMPRGPQAANAVRLDLREVDLRKADLAGAHLEGADLFRAHLEGAELNFAHLERSRLFGAHLEGAWLLDAHLEQAQLSGAHLQRAWLIRAHLEGAWLMGARLERAQLSGAHLQKAMLDGAHLEGADLSDVNLEGAVASAATVWPAGFEWREAGVIQQEEDLDEPTEADDEVTEAAAAGEREKAPQAGGPEEQDLSPEAVRNGLDETGEPEEPTHRR